MSMVKIIQTLSEKCSMLANVNFSLLLLEICKTPSKDTGENQFILI